MNTFDLSLDLNKGRNVNPVRIRQGDLNGTTIRALIFDHGAAADLSGLTARWAMRLPDGTEYYRKTATVDATASTVTVEVDETQAASVTGRARGYFQLLQGSSVIASTGDVLVEVLPDALEGATVAESYDSAIQEAIDDLNDAIEAIPDTVEDVLDAHPEWVTTVQDGAITEAKLAPDLAGDRARLLMRLDNLLTATLPEGDSATATDAAKTPLAGLSLYGRSTQDGTPTPEAPVPIVSVEGDSEGNISLVARGKNLLRNGGSSTTSYGVTFTVNADGSVTCGGTATAQARFDIGRDATTLPAGTYVCGEGTGSGYSIDVYKVVDGTATRIRSGFGTFTLDAETSVFVRIVVASGATVSATISPYIYAGSTATAFVPYAESVTPIDLDGHELRSLPDGTRDELAVDARGHAVLVQRVGSVDLGTLTWGYNSNGYFVTTGVTDKAAGNYNLVCDAYQTSEVPSAATMPDKRIKGNATTHDMYIKDSSYSTAADLKASLDGVMLHYVLAAPVTHDLGTVDPVALQGPDLVAQAVPTAPFALTYERDLNTTLARLEAALAALA